MTQEPAVSGDPLTPEHHRQLALAQERAKSIRLAAGMAAFNGWGTAVLAVFSLPFAIFGTTGILAVVVLTIVACNEFRGRRRLLRFDPSGATLLGWNQVGFLSMIVLYCLWELWSGLSGTSHIAQLLQAMPELTEVLPDIERLARHLTMLVCGLVIVLSVLFQGLNAWYYFSQRSQVERYRRETPAWIVELPRSS